MWAKCFCKLLHVGNVLEYAATKEENRRRLLKLSSLFNIFDNKLLRGFVAFYCDTND